MQFNGLILVIGQGSVLINGGGAGHIYGSIFVAQTNSSTSPFTQLASLGASLIHLAWRWQSCHRLQQLLGQHRKRPTLLCDRLPGRDVLSRTGLATFFKIVEVKIVE